MYEAVCGETRQLRQAIRDGVAAKPERHHMAEEGRSQTERNMNEIGG